MKYITAYGEQIELSPEQQAILMQRRGGQQATGYQFGDTMTGWKPQWSEPTPALDRTSSWFEQTIVDPLRSAGAGVNDLIAGGGWLLEQMGAEDWGGAIQEFGRSGVDYWESGLTQETRDALQRDLFDVDEEGNSDFNWTKLVNGITRSAPGMAAGMGAGAALTKGLQLFANPIGRSALVAATNVAPEAGLAARATAASATRTLKWLDGLIGAGSFAAGEGAVSLVLAGDAVSSIVEGKSHDELLKSARYRDLLESMDGLGTPEEAQAYAKKTLASEASSTAGWQSGLTTALLGAGMGAFYGRLLGKAGGAAAGRSIIDRLQSTRTGVIAGSAVGEALTEGAQSGVEQAVQNLAIRDYVDPEQQVGEGVGTAALEGAVLGGLMGGGFGALEAPKAPAPMPGADDRSERRLADLLEQAKSKGLNAEADAILASSRAPLGKLAGLTYLVQNGRLRDEDVTPNGVDVDAAANAAATSPLNDTPEPTDGQIEAGNYKKGHLRLQGFDISVENPAGSTRRSKPGAEMPWERTMRSHYGYIRGIEGADGDHLDAFIGPEPKDESPIFVVDQHNEDGSFDEHKVMLGYADEATAKAAYLAEYPDGWTGLGAIKQVTAPELKALAKGGKLAQPLASMPTATVPAQPVVPDQPAVKPADLTVAIAPDAPAQPILTLPEAAKAARAEKQMAALTALRASKGALDVRLGSTSVPLAVASKVRREFDALRTAGVDALSATDGAIERVMSDLRASTGTKAPPSAFDPETRAADQFSRSADELATALGLSPEQAAVVKTKLRTPLEKDRVTGLYKSEELDTTVRAVQDAGQDGIYVEADFANLGGANAALGSRGADALLREAAETVRAELELAGSTVGIRKGGDEFGFIVTGARKDTVERAMARARKRFVASMAAKGYSKLPHSKGGKPGIGLHYATGSIEPGRDVGEMLGKVDVLVEARKKGMLSYGIGSEVEAARAGSAAGPGAGGGATQAPGGAQRIDGRRGGTLAGGEPGKSGRAGQAARAAAVGLPPRVLDARKYDPNYDDLLTLIAKRGGLSRDSAAAEGLDPADMKAVNKRFVGRQPFRRNGGKSMDELAELLNELHFRGEPLTGNDALALVDAAVKGERVLSDQAQGVQSLMDGLERDEELAARRSAMRKPVQPEDLDADAEVELAPEEEDLELSRQEARMAKRDEGARFSVKAPRKTPELRAFLEGSKVQHVVYHATGADFSVFDTLGKSDLGAHFGSMEQANHIARSGRLDRGGDAAPNIMPVWISLKSPLRLKDTGTFHADGIAKQLEAKGILPRGEGKRIEKEIASNWRLRSKYDPIVRDAIITAGYDGVVYSNAQEGAGNSWIVFRPEQIKSAIGNLGTFDKNSQDIRFSLAPPTESAAFNRWFGDSKVVDADGKPMVVYHGSSAKRIDAFDAAKIGTNGRMEGAGFYFTTDHDTAKGYGQKGTVVDAYLSIKKPLEYNARPFTQAQMQKLVAEVAKAEAKDTGNTWKDGFMSNYVDTYGKGFEAAVKEVARAFALEESAIDQIGGLIGSGVDADTVNAGLTSALGYDGYVSKGYVGEEKGGGVIWVAMRPEQIKSASANTGAFDPKNPDIRYSVGNEDTPAPPVPARKGTSVEAIRGLTDLLQWKGLDDLVIAQTEAELPEGARAMIPADYAGRVEGFYWNGSVYVVAANLETPADAYRVLVEETLGHGGLRRLFGEPARDGEADRTLDRKLDEVYAFAAKSHAAEIREIASSYGLNTMTPAGRRVAAEEFLAKMDPKSPGFFRGIYDWMRETLRAMGFKVNLSDTDLHRMMKRAHDAARAGLAPGFGAAWDGVSPRMPVDGRFALAGEKAKTANIGTLKEAQALIAAGQSAESVRKQTGWFKGLDDKWRFEIDDSNAFLMGGGSFEDVVMARYRALGKQAEPINIGDILYSTELFAAYPSLAEIEVRFTKPGSSALGRYAAEEGFIEVKGSIPSRQALSVILHELQHEIQYIEGFARGGSVETIAEEMRKAEARLARVENSDEVKQAREWISSATREVLDRNLPDKEELAKLQEIEAHAVKTWSDFAEFRKASAEINRFGLSSPREAYRRLAGETEARNVQARQRMTAAQRRETSPQETQDIPDDQQIVRFSLAPQTETEAFKRWFGDSKVVDADGKPMVMYHGTNKTQNGEAFTWFDTYGSNYGLFGQGAYFTDDSSVAGEYTAKGSGEAPTVYPVYLSIKNPIDMDAQADPDAWIEAFSYLDSDLREFHEGGTTNESWFRTVEDTVSGMGMPKWEGAEIMQDGLRKMGYDGITHIGGGRVKSEGKRHRVFIAFEPEQIKSAIGNTGAFDPQSPDIRFSVKRTKGFATGDLFDQPTAAAAPAQPVAKGLTWTSGSSIVRESVGRIKSPKTIKSMEDAAVAFSSILRNRPNERFIAIVTDKDSRPIATYELGRGGISHTDVDVLTMAHSVYGTKDARTVHIAHNHPAGTVRASDADVALTRRLRDAFPDDGDVVLGHHVIIADENYTNGAKQTSDSGVVPARKDLVDVPVFDRLVEKKPGGFAPGTIGKAISSVAELQDYVKGKIENGIVLLDSQLRPVANIEMTSDMMLRLKGGTAKAIFEIADQANASSAAIVASGDELIKRARNVAAMLNSADMRVIDMVLEGKAVGTAGSPGVVYFSIKRAKGSAQVESILERTQAQAVEDMSLGDRVRAWLARIAGHSKSRMKESLIQGFLDEGHGLKVLEQQTAGRVLDASVSAHKMYGLTKNLSSVVGAVMKAGVPVYSGGVFRPAAGRMGLIDIFRPLFTHPDGSLLHLWEGYAAAVRAKRLINEKNPDGTSREKLMTQADIDELLKLEQKYPEFKVVHDRWQRFNGELLDLAVDRGVIDGAARAAWTQNDYVPFYRAMEDAEGSRGPGTKSGISGQQSGIKRLFGSSEKIGSIFENMLGNTTHLLDRIYKNEAMRRVVELAAGTALKKVPMSMQAVKFSNEDLARALLKAGLLVGSDSTAAAAKVNREIHWGSSQAAVDAALSGTGVPSWAIRAVEKMTPSQIAGWTNLFRPVAPVGRDIVSVMVGGKPEYYEAADPLLLRTLNAMGPPQFGVLMSIMTGAKNFLTKMVTADPGFMAANFMRDALSSWATSRAPIKPLVDSIRGAAAAYVDDPLKLSLMMAGAGMGGYYGADKAAVRLDLQKELKGSSGITLNPLKALGAFWRGYQRIGEAGEAGSRMAIAKSVLDRGGSQAEAAYEAMDIMNFSMRGDFAAMQTLTAIVPFLNARVQGLYKLARAGASENPAGFFLKGAVIMAATIALWAMNADDDRYNELPEWDKDTNWHFWVGDQHFKLPKPFEVGAIFGTIPERIAQLAAGNDSGKVAFEALSRMIVSTFAINPVPQLFGPVLEQYANRSAFTGDPVVNQSLQGMLPEQQYTPWTSETARVLADLAPDFAPEWLRSPVRVEALLRGYAGTMGMYALQASNVVTRGMLDLPDPAASRPEDWPVVRRFYAGEINARTKYEQQLYDALDKANDTFRSVGMLTRYQRIEEAQALRADNAKLLQYRGMLTRTSTRIRDLNTRSRLVMSNPTMTPDEKRAMLDQITQQRAELLRQARPIIESAMGG